MHWKLSYTIYGVDRWNRQTKGGDTAVLLDLHIDNFVLIDRLDLAFDSGLTVLTGETGAGKSIIVDALGALLGERLNAADVIKTGEKSALIEAAFAPNAAVNVSLSEAGIAPEEDCLILSREILRSGRSRYRVNGQIATLTLLQKLGDSLVDIHGQHEHQSLLKAPRRLDMLDAFGGAELAQLRAQVGRLATSYRDAHKELATLAGNERERIRQLELLGYQIDEIGEAHLRIGEDEELEEERTLLANAEELALHLDLAYRALYENEIGAAADLVGQAVASLSEAARVDRRSQEILIALQSVESLIAEQAREVRYRREEIQANPQRLEEVEARLMLIGTLKRKYGDTIEEILEFARSAEEEMEHLQAGSQRVHHLEAEVEELAASYVEGATELHQRRLAAASLLQERVESELRDLGMEQATFLVQVTCREDPNGLLIDDRRVAVSDGGYDHCDFLFSANPGEAPRSLAAVASGGELSRVMLALKSVLASSYDVPTLVFDEVDAGIGGRTAQAVARKLSIIASERQVLCVTHLAQIAARANTHIQIDKTTDGASTRVTLRSLSEKERVLELARMLDGTQTPATVEHARQMLALTQKGAS